MAQNVLWTAGLNLVFSSLWNDQNIFTTAKSQYDNNKINYCTGKQKTAFGDVNKILCLNEVVLPGNIKPSKDIIHDCLITFCSCSWNMQMLYVSITLHFNGMPVWTFLLFHLHFWRLMRCDSICLICCREVILSSPILDVILMIENGPVKRTLVVKFSNSSHSRFTRRSALIICVNIIHLLDLI